MSSETESTHYGYCAQCKGPARAVVLSSRDEVYITHRDSVDPEHVVRFVIGIPPDGCCYVCGLHHHLQPCHVSTVRPSEAQELRMSLGPVAFRTPPPLAEDLTKVLARLQTQIAIVNDANGWRTERPFVVDMAYLHSEVSEALDAYEKHGMDTFRGEGNKPEGVLTELADLLIRVIYMLDVREVSIEDFVNTIIEKNNYNRTRGYRHGKKD